ncbi:MAG: hypothetical protein JSR67_03675 [Proteobacteria bacterium]|nr:hypothetical protein [Pseudomonadota bacterium]
MTSIFQDSDIPGMIAAFGVPVVIGQTTLSGMRDEAGRDVLNPLTVAGVSATAIVVWVQTSALPPNLPNAFPCTVDGENFVIRDRLPYGDGALTHLLCERPS